jgi:mono/diheme cytochrome c family protein
MERGAFVFRTFCVPCHGGSGRGDGPVALRGYPAPASLLAEKAIHMTDGQIFHVLTFGQKNMPSYASQLSEDDRWKVILYVRSMQGKAGQP